MSSSYISAELRRLVESRAEKLCEYCLIAEEDTFLGCEMDHIISEKHGGLTQAENLANACVCCNQAKGSDVGSFHQPTASFVRFFNPRTDLWVEHFALSGFRIEPLTPIGEVTARILGFNARERLLERETLVKFRRYPSTAAVHRISTK
jgi:hypothetical protein